MEAKALRSQYLELWYAFHRTVSGGINRGLESHRAQSTAPWPNSGSCLAHFIYSHCKVLDLGQFWYTWRYAWILLHRNVILSSEVLEKINQQNSWNSSEISIYPLHLIWNLGMLEVKIGVTTVKHNHTLRLVWGQGSLHAFTNVNSSLYVLLCHRFPHVRYSDTLRPLPQLLWFHPGISIS
jgi:hypothetical protein